MNRRATQQGNGATKLAPHSLEAEVAVVGCMLLGGAATVGEVAAVAGADGEMFYDGRHRTIYGALVWLRGEQAAIDALTVRERLKDTGRQEEVPNCLQYLLACMEQAPSAASVDYYLKILEDKWAARRLLKVCVETSAAVYEYPGTVESLVARTRVQVEDLQRRSFERGKMPERLKAPWDFAEKYLEEMFRSPGEEPGMALPINFAHRIRMGETTLVTGDNGCGKSTLLTYFYLHLAREMESEDQRAEEVTDKVTEQVRTKRKVCIASFEMGGATTLWYLAAQLLGRRRLPESREGRFKAMQALQWLNERFLIWDFLGIGDWREVLDGFRYARDRMGARIFGLDSIMRVGIAEDDYAQQAFAAAAFANFCQEEPQCHLFHVAHDNKSGATGKERVSGSKKWSDNAWNIWAVERNMKKGTKLGELEHDLERAKRDGDKDEIRSLEKDWEHWRKEWDTHVVLQKQRMGGTQQNASKFFFFDTGSFQFRTRWEEVAVDWLSRWAERPREPREGEAVNREEEGIVKSEICNLESDIGEGEV